MKSILFVLLTLLLCLPAMGKQQSSRWFMYAKIETSKGPIIVALDYQKHLLLSLTLSLWLKAKMTLLQMTT
jgi:hypothetical protein